MKTASKIALFLVILASCGDFQSETKSDPTCPLVGECDVETRPKPLPVCLRSDPPNAEPTERLALNISDAMIAGGSPLTCLPPPPVIEPEPGVCLNLEVLPAANPKKHFRSKSESVGDNAALLTSPPTCPPAPREIVKFPPPAAANVSISYAGLLPSGGKCLLHAKPSGIVKGSIDIMIEVSTDTDVNFFNGLPLRSDREYGNESASVTFEPSTHAVLRFEAGTLTCDFEKVPDNPHFPPIPSVHPATKYTGEIPTSGTQCFLDVVTNSVMEDSIDVSFTQEGSASRTFDSLYWDRDALGNRDNISTFHGNGVEIDFETDDTYFNHQLLQYTKKTPSGDIICLFASPGYPTPD